MPAYQTFNAQGEVVKLHDLQDKGPWCATGATYEQVFLLKYGIELGLAINPKKEADPYVPDLIKIADGRIADLKTQNTPFFKARSLHKIDPQFAITFNGKDYRRYKRLYPSIDIYFWVSWIPIKFVMGATTIVVDPMEGIWNISLVNIDKMIKDGASNHQYQQRIGDRRGNAQDSYVFDLQNPLFTKLK